MTVYDMTRKMPMSELTQWFAFYEMKLEQSKAAEKGKSTNLLDMDPEALAKAFADE